MVTGKVDKLHSNRKRQERMKIIKNGGLFDQ